MAERSRRQVREPARFSPSAVRSSKRERSPPPPLGDGLDALIMQNAEHHSVIHADLAALREDAARQTRQFARVVRALADIQDILLDMHEEGARETTKMAKSADPDVVSLQASAEEIPVTVVTVPEPEPEPAPTSVAASAPEPQKSESPFPAGSVSPALLARMNSMAN